jgi:CRP-like cAMP-binding protein
MASSDIPGSLPAALESALGPAYVIPARATIVRQGDPLTAVMLLEDGYAKAIESYATRDIIVSICSSGWLLGALSAMSGETRHLLGAETLSACRLRPVSIDRFLALTSRDLDVSNTLTRLMAREAADNLKLGALRGTRAEDRLVALLVHLARLDSRPGKDGSIQIMVPLQTGSRADARHSARTVQQSLEGARQEGNDSSCCWTYCDPARQSTGAKAACTVNLNVCEEVTSCRWWTRRLKYK